MKIAILTTDNRDAHRRYDDAEPYFGPAPTALLEGFAMLGNQLVRSEIASQISGEAKVGSFEIHVISCTQQPLVAPEKLAPNIWYHSLHVPKIGWLRTGYQGCVGAVRKKIREINPDIVHGQGTERDCAISAVFCGYPNVLTIHGNMAELARRFGARLGSFHWLMGKLEDFTLPKTAGVFCNSDYTLGLVAGRAKKTWRVANPIRSEFFRPLVTKDMQTRPILINIGVIGERKRQIELLEMMGRIHSRGVSLEMRFMGPYSQEPYAKEFKRRIMQAENEGYASYGGALDAKGLVSEMDRASGICHFPSEEAFGLVVAEGIARNLKFFGSRVGGIPSISEGVGGSELINLDDFFMLENAITAWVASGAPKTMGGYELMQSRYHPTVIAAKHLEIYLEVLGTTIT